MTEVPPGASDTPTTLLVSPSLQGHRVIYCRVLAGLIAGAGRRVVVASDLRDPAVAGDPLLIDLEATPGVELRDTSPIREGRTVTVQGLRELAANVRADTVFLAEADDLAGRLADLRSALAHVRLVGLFIRSTNYQYHRRPSAVARVRRRLRGSAGPDAAWEEFHTRTLPSKALLDAALVLDERFAEEHSRTHHWLPDIYEEAPDAHGRANGETALWKARLAAFLAAAGTRPLLVYVGANQERRGYDRLLRLALDEGAVVAHCGLFSLDGEPTDAEVLGLRAELESRAAFLGTEGAYLHPETATLFLRAARCVVFPYRGHDGSSGVMLQALAAGRPVLVPDRGLMAFRTRAFGLGGTYRDGDADDLRRAFRALQARPPEGFLERARGYLAFFSQEQVAAAVRAAMFRDGPGAVLPRQVAPGRDSGARWDAR